MPTDAGTPTLSNSPLENTEIISKTMIGPLSYTPLTMEGAHPYPVSRTDQGVSRDRRGRRFPEEPAVSDREWTAARCAQGSQAPTQALPRWMQATCVASSLTAQPCCSA